MSIGPVPTVETAKVVYLVERRPPHAESTHPLLDKIKHAAGAAIALFGLIFLTFAAAALIGNLVGLFAFTAGNLEMAFMIGMVGTVSGFNLSTKGNQAAEVYLGPLSVTV